MVSQKSFWVSRKITGMSRSICAAMCRSTADSAPKDETRAMRPLKWRFINGSRMSMPSKKLKRLIICSYTDQSPGMRLLEPGFGFAMAFAPHFMLTVRTVEATLIGERHLARRLEPDLGRESVTDLE